MAEKYALSYTAAGLRRIETATLAEAYLGACGGDWDALRKSSVEDDLLMIKQESSRKRVTGELIKRLKNYTPAEMKAIAAGLNSEAGNAVVWVGLRANYYDKNGKNTATQEELDRYVKNIYYVLLTRGILGTHVYAVNPKMRQYLSRFFPQSV